MIPPALMSLQSLQIRHFYEIFGENYVYGISLYYQCRLCKVRTFKKRNHGRERKDRNTYFFKETRQIYRRRLFSL